MLSNESEVSPHVVPSHFTVYELITEELRKETITHKANESGVSSLYILYIYLYIYFFLYISLNITKYLLLVHCTKMIFKTGNKGGKRLWAKKQNGNVSEVREKQAMPVFSIALRFVQYSGVCVQ